MSQLDGRRILITGASSGIGRATAIRFAREGCATALLGRDESRLRALHAELDAPFVCADLTDSDAVAGAVRGAAEALGGLDGIVNAAGISLYRRYEEIALADWTQMIATNLTAPFLVCQAALPYLRETNGATIVNISSASAILPAPFTGASAYVASKGGLNGLSRALAVELAPNIRVNVVCPGAVKTAMMGDVTEDQLAEYASHYALRRVATPEEIAGAALFLSSRESSFMTGCLVAVDGGRSYH